MTKNTDAAAQHYSTAKKDGGLQAIYHQNNEIIEQNERIIKLLTDIRGFSGILLK
jgi:hypothetical protein